MDDNISTLHDTMIQAAPGKEAKGKANTATWKKRYHRIGFDIMGVPVVRRRLLALLPLFAIGFGVAQVLKQHTPVGLFFYAQL
jgi:hypothetical protein